MAVNASSSIFAMTFFSRVENPSNTSRRNGFDTSSNSWNVALGIATLKSGLVVAYFMHMKYESWLFKLALFTTLAILAIFIGLNFFDVLYR